MAIKDLNGQIGVLSEAQFIANELGINDWQLTQGSYNGVIFHVVKTILNRLNDEFNPAAGIIDSTEELIGGSFNANNNSNLPYGTSTVSTAITDISTRKMVRFNVPNGADVFEKLGWEGDIYVIRGIIFGSSYGIALDNILNKFINDKNVSTASQNILVHPVLGTIPGKTYLMAHKRIHNPNLWRSVMYEFIFRSTVPYSNQADNAASNVAQLNTQISAALAISTSLLNTWNDVKTLQVSFASSGNTYTIQRALNANQESIKTTVNTSITTAKLLVNNLKSPSYNNVALEKTPTTPTNKIPSYYYFINNMTPSDVNSIINNNNDIVKTAITLLNDSFNDNIIYSTITNLIALQATLIQIATILLNSYYGVLQQYIVPYDMDLLTLCLLNHLDYSTQGDLVYLLNRAIIPSANYIPKNTSLNIPISSTRAPRLASI